MKTNEDKSRLLELFIFISSYASFWFSISDFCKILSDALWFLSQNWDSLSDKDFRL